VRRGLLPRMQLRIFIVASRWLELALPIASWPSETAGASVSGNRSTSNRVFHRELPDALTDAT
jgi:hypothetical protein